MGEENGAGSPELSQNEIIEQMAHVVFSEVFSLLELMGPPLDREVAMQLAQQAAREQVLTIPQQILPTLMGEARDEYPTFAVSICKESSRKSKDARVARVKAPKNLSLVSDEGVALQSAAILALMLTPAARALLRAQGFHIEFSQSKEAPQGSIIRAVT